VTHLDLLSKASHDEYPHSNSILEGRPHHRLGRPQRCRPRHPFLVCDGLQAFYLSHDPSAFWLALFVAVLASVVLYSIIGYGLAQLLLVVVTNLRHGVYHLHPALCARSPTVVASIRLPSFLLR
jgi:hypothetical protein